MEKVEEASLLDPQYTTPELRELIGTFTLGCWLFMHAFLKQWKMRAFLTYWIMSI